MVESFARGVPEQRFNAETLDSEWVANRAFVLYKIVELLPSDVREEFSFIDCTLIAKSTPLSRQRAPALFCSYGLELTDQAGLKLPEMGLCMPPS